MNVVTDNIHIIGSWLLSLVYDLQCVHDATCTYMFVAGTNLQLHDIVLPVLNL